MNAIGKNFHPILCERCRRETDARHGDDHVPAIESLDLAALPSLSVADYRHLPNCSAVYFAISQNRICYIGEAVDLSHRWAGHLHRIRLEHEKAGEIFWLEINDKVKRQGFERLAIKHFHPLWNKGGAEYCEDFDVADFNRRVRNERRRLRGSENFQRLRNKRAVSADVPFPG